MDASENALAQQIIEALALVVRSSAQTHVQLDELLVSVTTEVAKTITGRSVAGGKVRESIPVKEHSAAVEREMHRLKAKLGLDKPREAGGLELPELDGDSASDWLNDLAEVMVRMNELSSARAMSIVAIAMTAHLPADRTPQHRAQMMGLFARMLGSGFPDDEFFKALKDAKTEANNTQATATAEAKTNTEVKANAEAKAGGGSEPAA